MTPNIGKCSVVFEQLLGLLCKDVFPCSRWRRPPPIEDPSDGIFNGGRVKGIPIHLRVHVPVSRVYFDILLLFFHGGGPFPSWGSPGESPSFREKNNNKTVFIQICIIENRKKSIIKVLKINKQFFEKNLFLCQSLH